MFESGKMVMGTPLYYTSPTTSYCTKGQEILQRLLWVDAERVREHSSSLTMRCRQVKPLTGQEGVDGETIAAADDGDGPVLPGAEVRHAAGAERLRQRDVPARRPLASDHQPRRRPVGEPGRVRRGAAVVRCLQH